MAATDATQKGIARLARAARKTEKWLGLSPFELRVYEQRLAEEAAQHTKRDSKKHRCLHGAVPPRAAKAAGTLKPVSQLCEMTESVPETAGTARRAFATHWLRENWPGLSPTSKEQFIPLIRSMAADAALSADEDRVAFFLSLAFWRASRASRAPRGPRASLAPTRGGERR